MEKNKNKGYENSRREIMDRSGSRASRRRLRGLKDRDNKKVGRYFGFSEWVRLREGAERDASWLAGERARLMGWPREELIRWLQWNDHNGSFSDEDSEREGMDPITVEDAVDLIMNHVEENMETPEEMVRGARVRGVGAMPWAWDGARVARR